MLRVSCLLSYAVEWFCFQMTAESRANSSYCTLNRAIEFNIICIISIENVYAMDHKNPALHLFAIFILYFLFIIAYSITYYHCSLLADVPFIPHTYLIYYL